MARPASWARTPTIAATDVHRGSMSVVAYGHLSYQVQFQHADSLGQRIAAIRRTARAPDFVRTGSAGGSG